MSQTKISRTSSSVEDGVPDPHVAISPSRADKDRAFRERAQFRWLVAMGVLDVTALAIDRIALGDLLILGFSLRFGVVLPLVMLGLALHVWTSSARLQSIATAVATIAFVATITALGQYASEPFPSRYMLIAQWVMFAAIIFAGLPWRDTKIMAIVSFILFSVIVITSLRWTIAPLNIDLSVLCIITSVLALSIRWRKDAQLAELFVMRRVDKARAVELRKANDNLALLSQTDALTGVFNRRYLEDYIDRSSATLAPSARFGVMMIDVDYFKLFNDHAGHVEGDRCLRLIARALQSGLRSANDALVRYGGEEFAVILPDADFPEAIAVAERLRFAVRELCIAHPGRGANVSVSIGVFASNDSDLTHALGRADKALYDAKQAGRDSIVGASPHLDVDETLREILPDMDRQYATDRRRS